jgi:hypothetical protein
MPLRLSEKIDVFQEDMALKPSIGSSLPPTLDQELIPKSEERAPQVDSAFQLKLTPANQLIAQTFNWKQSYAMRLWANAIQDSTKTIKLQVPFCSQYPQRGAPNYPEAKKKGLVRGPQDAANHAEGQAYVCRDAVRSMWNLYVRREDIELPSKELNRLCLEHSILKNLEDPRDDKSHRLKIDPDKAQRVREDIDRCLTEGLPVPVMVAYGGRKTGDGTDHMCIITGRTEKPDGSVTYTYLNPGTQYADRAEGIFRVDSKTGALKAINANADRSSEAHSFIVLGYLPYQRKFHSS